jgi:hypothetical protein
MIEASRSTRATIYTSQTVTPIATGSRILGMRNWLTLAEGYQGMRVVGDAFWLDQSAWRDFYEYEMELSQ